MSRKGFTILSVAYPFAALGPSAAGGAEQVLSTIEAAIVRHGHRSIVAAHAGSQTAGELLGIPVPPGELTPQVRRQVETATQLTLERALERAFDRALATRSIDLVHMHGIDFHRYALPRHLPILVTLHLPPSWYPGSIWSLPPNYHLQCVSETQREACPAHARHRLGVVGNGVPLPAASTLPSKSRGRRSYALLLSRICPEKNLHTALDAARQANLPVLLAGHVHPYPDHLRYFEAEIRPRLGPHARFLGPVGGAAKQRLLARAACLLVPSLAPETSSLVAMEALAAGTPVIAFRSGALPEVIDHGRTGFLVQNADEMSAALLRLHEIDPETCRTTARQRFSAQAMTGQYLNLYKTLTA